MLWVILINMYRRRHPEKYCPQCHPWKKDSPREVEGAQVPAGWWYCKGWGCRSIRRPDGTVLRTKNKEAFRAALSDAAASVAPPAPPMPT